MKPTERYAKDATHFAHPTCYFALEPHELTLHLAGLEELLAKPHLLLCTLLSFRLVSLRHEYLMPEATRLRRTVQLRKGDDERNGCRLGWTAWK